MIPYKIKFPFKMKAYQVGKVRGRDRDRGGVGPGEVGVGRVRVGKGGVGWDGVG